MERALHQQPLAAVGQVMRVLVAPAGQSMAALAETAPNSNSHQRLEVEEAAARELAPSLAERAAITAPVAAALATEAARAQLVYASSPTHRRLLDGPVQKLITAASRN
jgi:hypothetical protein